MSFPIARAAWWTASSRPATGRCARGRSRLRPGRLRADRTCRFLRSRGQPAARYRCPRRRERHPRRSIRPQPLGVASAIERASVTLMRATGAAAAARSRPVVSAAGHEVSEPEIALVFTAEPWVEELHRHLSDHGGARVRSLVVEQSVALEETYDVLVAESSLAGAHAGVRRGRARTTRRVVVGVHDRAEPASRRASASVGVDALDRARCGSRCIRSGDRESPRPVGPSGRVRPARFRVGSADRAVGGPPGVGRDGGRDRARDRDGAQSVERRALDCDDVAPAIARGSQLPIEPNLRTAIDAVEHGRGDLERVSRPSRRRACRSRRHYRTRRAGAQVRPGEVVRVVDRLGDDRDVVVVDGLGIPPGHGPRAGHAGRFATARALVNRGRRLVAVCDASPATASHCSWWAVEARAIAPTAPTARRREPGSRRLFTGGASCTRDQLEHRRGRRRVRGRPTAGSATRLERRDRPPRTASPGRSLGSPTRFGRSRVDPGALAARERSRRERSGCDAYGCLDSSATTRSTGIERRRLQPDRAIAEVHAEIERAVDDYQRRAPRRRRSRSAIAGRWCTG